MSHIRVKYQFHSDNSNILHIINLTQHLKEPLKPKNVIENCYRQTPKSIKNPKAYVLDKF